MVALPARTSVFDGRIVEEVRGVVILGMRVRVVAQDREAMRQALLGLHLERVVMVVAGVTHALQPDIPSVLRKVGSALIRGQTTRLGGIAAGTEANGCWRIDVDPVVLAHEDMQPLLPT